ncbi:MAG: hypothetical protein U0235_14295 [Polyangiaceae bacterium]
MDASEFDEVEFFRALADSQARVLVIGRKALIMLGLPVATHDYDLWLHIDDIERLNAAVAPFEHYPNVSPVEARARGRYVLENGEHIDVLLTRSRTTHKGETLTFDDAWQRRERIELADGVSACVPCIDDLIRTKEWAMRAKDIGDIQLLEALRKSQRGAS